MQMDFNKRSCKILGEDYGDEFANHQNTYKPGWLTGDFFDLAETWKDTISGSNCLIIKNENDMSFIKEKNPSWYESLMINEVKSIVLFPLISHENLLGYIWATNFATEDAETIKETLELTTFFLASEISNHQLLENMQIMSTIDVLTGVYNRNWMNTIIDQISGNTEGTDPLGIFFIDVNGLKTVNDNEGHYAGDMLIKNAALVLQTVFVHNGIFRAGGDEFLVLIANAKEDEMASKNTELKKLCQEHGISLSSGWVWEPNSKNILSALKIADERMYADKEAFYKKSGKKRRA